MKDCSAALLENAPLDARKLPNYVFGMVLGPSDFRQVLENFEWKHRNANLLLHGSGTVCGLKVSAQLLPSDTDLRITVSAGFAISPRGRWMWVDKDQCASLNKWLQAQQSLPYASPGPGTHRAYVRLCYNQCLTDLVPIAGQSCAPDQENQAPSRLLESYRLDFSWTPPAQALEDRARLFGALMRQVEIVDMAGSLPAAGDGQRLFAAVRALALDPLPTPGSLPGGSAFRLNSSDAEAVIREALTIWVTEICPAISSKPELSPLLHPAADDGLSLAAIEFTVDNAGQLSLPVDSLGNLLPGAVVIDETKRAVILPSRILQELFTGAGGAGLGARSELTGTVELPAPGGSWPQFATVRSQPLINVAPDASIELSIEGSNPSPFPATANMALSLYRPAQSSSPSEPVIAATYLCPSGTVPPLKSVTVRWRAIQG